MKRHIIKPNLVTAFILTVIMIFSVSGCSRTNSNEALPIAEAAGSIEASATPVTTTITAPITTPAATPAETPAETTSTTLTATPAATSSATSSATPTEGKTVSVTLYFGDDQAMYVVPEKREITVSADESLEAAIFKELQKGPLKEGHYAVIPKGTKLLSISVDDGTCTIDLSREFVDNSPGGTAGESMTLESVVSSLTELDYIRQVQFLIEGEKREVYTHVIFNEPFKRNEAAIKPESD